MASHKICPTCDALNRSEAKACYACGDPLESEKHGEAIASTLTNLSSPPSVKIWERSLYLESAGLRTPSRATA